MNLQKLFFCFIFIFVLIFNSLNLFSQEIINKKILWQEPRFVDIENKQVKSIHFSNCSFNNTSLPVYQELIYPHNSLQNPIATVRFTKFSPLSDEENLLIGSFLPKSENDISTSIVFERKKAVVSISFIPLQINPKNGRVEKVSEFEIVLNENSEKVELKNSNSISYKEHSVLASGKWVKIKVKENGIYKLSYSELSSLGFSDPSHIHLYGNPCGMLSVQNSEPTIDDLEEMPVKHTNSSIIFYAKGPNTWNYSGEIFTHKIHYFSDFMYYFLTENPSEGKTTEQEANSNLPANYYVSKFNDYFVHELNDTNMLKSGNRWYGEEFNMMNTMNISADFPNLVKTDTITATISVIVRSDDTSSFTVVSNNQTIIHIQNIGVVDLSDPDYTFALTRTQSGKFLNQSDNLTFNLTYNLPNTVSQAWLDYLRVNAIRDLTMTGSQMSFRNAACVDTGNVSQFTLKNAGSQCQIWDVTDPLNTKMVQVEYSSASNSLTFKLATDSLKEFIAFDGTSYLTPEIVGEIANQDLHGSGQPDMVIVTHPDFLSQAQQLADLHYTKDNLQVLVVTPEQVYNEFSSGTDDVSAIRNFMRMLYKRANNLAELPQFLLLFGDGSYNNKLQSSANSNFIITYQSDNSLNPIQSYVSDDFFALLDDNEGGLIGLMDISTGRIPAKNVEEAQDVVNKIIHYVSEESMNDWRNIVCFIGDDPDNANTNGHTIQAEEMADYLNSNFPAYNIDKIYLDAYQQIAGASGERYPDVNIAIGNRIQKGALIINYTGHGGETGLAHEQIVTMNDISNWKNFDNLPLFVTATCEFSRFDDFWRTSGGENTLLNPQGGGIALFSTTRPVYASSLSNNFYATVFTLDSNEGRNADEINKPDCHQDINTKHGLKTDNQLINNNKHRNIGEVIRITKNITDNGSSDNSRKFILLGDPALCLAYPKYNVETTHINGITVTTFADTLKALDIVNVSGIVTDENGVKLSNINGVLTPTIFDKPKTLFTLGNEGNEPMSFDIQNNILYKGNASIINGEFNFSFVIPKDIAYNYDFGKISYYAKSGLEDANGYYKGIFIGGSSENAEQDNEGPEIALFMNDSNFVNGGITNENPKLLAYLNDFKGINTVGNGIGHDITAILDDNSSETYVLNDYYVSDLDSYQSGTINFPFYNLSHGKHVIRLKVWDIYNNSSEGEIEFFVENSSSFVIEQLKNYPNPFIESTFFTFAHNQSDVNMNIKILISDITGRFVRKIEKDIFSDNFNPEPIEWNGKDDNGQPVERGMYIYQLIINTSSGKTAQKTEKLVYLK